MALYCTRCGKENSDDASYCGSCGNRMGGSETNPMNSQNAYMMYYDSRAKNEGLGVIMSFFFVGLGHLYAGKITAGLLLILASILLISLVSVALLFSISLFFVSAALLFILWIWALYDVYTKIKLYNAELRRTGNPPW